jgi:hypothetical protein
MQKVVGNMIEIAMMTYVEVDINIYGKQSCQYIMVCKMCGSYKKSGRRKNRGDLAYFLDHR